MRVVETLRELRLERKGLPNPLGLVPTMGYLHEGHLSLIRRSRADGPSTGVSIFVNPAQFGPGEDLVAYPRDLDRDLGLLEAEGVDLVWTPPGEEVYPDSFQTWITVERVSRGLEGARRPGHFRGVATVVAKLFNAFQPQRAYFGQKDAQQVVVVRQMARDLDIPVEIVVCPTLREPDGLAMSSRNVFLSPEERQAATVLFRALTAAQQAFESGVVQAEALRLAMRQVLATEPMARPEYVSVADPATLDELTGRVDEALLSLAVHIGATALIDNLIV
jgi:pantoate--beta-alanine ligase